MRVVVEIRSNSNFSTFRPTRVTMSRVPSVKEIIRVLGEVDGMTTAFWFEVTEVTHTANTSAYPKREDEIDAWVTCRLTMDGRY